MTAIGDAYFARLHPATSETLGLAASGDLHHPKAQSSKIEDGVHEPVVTLVTRRHYGGGVDCNQPLLARIRHRLRVALGQECGGNGAQPVGAGPQPVEDGDIQHRRPPLGRGPGRKPTQRQTPENIGQAQPKQIYR